MSLLVFAGVVAVGFASGVLSGMFGVGGAVLTTPGVRLLGATPIESVGSTIPAILPGALSGAWRYSRARMVDWSIALPSGLLGAGFAVLGAEASDHVNGHYLMLLTAAMLLWSGLNNVRDRTRPPEKVAVPVGGPADAEGVEVHEHVHAVGHARSTKPSRTTVAVIGAAAGMLAGLLGVGGGVLLVPAYTGLLRMPAKRAVATSLVAVAIFSVPAMITHALLGHINWAYALPLVVGVVPGAQVGARVTIHGSEARLRFLMGLFFTVLALLYGAGELLSL
ncbi:MAG TPA: sulfite exporter TauE/SafE family protein [Acidimicrobiales bacterium]|nr:sulfite exporter TauE/SafE family protein [Acidimicrobiales bacterium]